MSQRPSISKKRIVKKVTRSKRSVAKTTAQRRTASGTHAMQARRDEIVVTGKQSTRVGMLRCPECGAIFHDKHWHAPSLFPTADVVLLEPHRCDECKLAASGASVSYAGELTLEGPFDGVEKEEILHLVRNVGKRANERDPEDRIVRIREQGGRIVVLTTENQLAVSIGKQVHRARKGGTLEIVWSKTDKPARVHWKKV